MCFAKDAMQMLIALRQAAQSGEVLDRKTEEDILLFSSRIHFADAKEIGAELLKIINAPYAAKVLRTQAGKKMLSAICPIFHLMDGCAQNNQYHCGDVYEHTMMALENSWNCSTFPSNWADTEVRMALLLHDTGKPLVKTTDSDGHDHFYEHAPKSAEVAKNLLQQLQYEEAFVDTVVMLVKHHDIVFSPTKPAARRMVNKFGEQNTRRLLKIRECDNRAHSKLAYPKFETGAVPFVKQLDDVLSERNTFGLKQLDIDGTIIMKELGLCPGPCVGCILNHLLNGVVTGQIENEKDQLLAAAKIFANELKA